MALLPLSKSSKVKAEALLDGLTTAAGYVFDASLRVLGCCLLIFHVSNSFVL